MAWPAAVLSLINAVLEIALHWSTAERTAMAAVGSTIRSPWRAGGVRPGGVVVLRS